MNFLTPEQEMWRTTVARFIDEEIGRDYIRKCDREREYPMRPTKRSPSRAGLASSFPRKAAGWAAISWITP